MGNKRKKSKISISDKIGIGSLIVGFLSVILSGGFMYLAYDANWISADAVKAANTANDLSKANRKSDSIQSISDSIKRLTDYKNQIKGLELTQKSVESQLLDLEEKRKQFEITHTPFLQFDNLQLSLKVGEPIKLIYRLNNLGGYPAKILSDDSGMLVYKEIPKKGILAPQKESGDNIVFIYNSVPATLSIESKGNLSKQDSIQLINKKLFVYMYFDYTYLNPINNRKRKFKSLAEFVLPGANNYRTHYSENFDVQN